MDEDETMQIDHNPAQVALDWLIMDQFQLPCSSARLFNLQPIYLFHNKLFLSAIYQLLILPIQFLYWYLAQGYIYMFCMILFEFTY